MSTLLKPHDLLMDAITVALKGRIESAAQELVKTAIKDLEQRASEIAASVAVDVLGMVEMQTMTDRIVITIRKP